MGEIMSLRSGCPAGARQRKPPLPAALAGPPGEVAAQASTSTGGDWWKVRARAAA